MTQADLREYVNKKSQLFFRRAVIYDNLLIGSDMLKVRIIPDMVGYDSDDLPCYANFNPTTIIKGLSERDTKGDINKASQVWVICTDDYKVGWVFGEANQQYDIEDEKVQDPYPFNAFKTHILRQHLNTGSAKYSEIKVLFSNVRFVDTYNTAGISEGRPETAVTLDVVNVRTGERWIMLQSGTSVSIMQNAIEFRVGSPDQSSSFLKMTASSIEMVANNISLYGRTSTSLGKHGLQLVGGLGSPTAVDGNPLIPILDISV